MTQPPDWAHGPVNDMAELYALHAAIRAAGGEVTRPVHQAIDALREAWDAALRAAQSASLVSGKLGDGRPCEASVCEPSAGGGAGRAL